MDRQTVFKKVSKILVPIEIVFVITSTIYAGVIFFIAINEYIKKHKVSMQQLYSNLAVLLIVLAIVSIILAIGLYSQSDSTSNIKQIIVFSITFFFAIPVIFLNLLTLYQYEYFPLIFFGSAFITIVSKVLAVIPNGIITKFMILIKSFKKNGA